MVRVSIRLDTPVFLGQSRLDIVERVYIGSSIKNNTLKDVLMFKREGNDLIELVVNQGTTEVFGSSSVQFSGDKVVIHSRGEKNTYTIPLPES